ncbi:MAG: beta-galactosidase [Dictyoglomus sp. NZ13-RE01]|nr:MAG: beta-galactosidase [Dictyoglomus sp. NZ13-RE01]
MINPKLPQIWYGGDYNPEQWPKEVWDEDVRLFRLANINIATVNVFSWSLIQPAEDKYDFSMLDEIIDKLWKNGIYICLATSTASQPHWMSVKYPEVLPVDINGLKRSHGGRVNFCPNSEVYRHFAVKLVEKLAERYANHPALLIWHIANEYGTYCYCENCERKFREWLKNRYKTLEELNKRWYTSFWGQTYYDWNEIPVPTLRNVLFHHWLTGKLSTVAQGLVLDYYRFMSESILECYKLEYDAVKKYNPNIPVTTNLMGTFKPLNYFEWAKYMDVVSWDNYPFVNDDYISVAFRHSLMRGLKQGMPFMLMEQTPSQTNWHPYCYIKRPKVMRLMSYQAVAHGADTVMFFQLRQSRGGPEKFHGAVISHAGHENTRVFQEVKELGEELKNLGDTLLDSRVKAQTAVLFDWENWWALENAQGPSTAISYVDGTEKYFRALHENQLGVDVIGVEDNFEKYKIIVAPLLYMTKEEWVKKIEDFVKNGGIFITTTLSGLVDENDLVILGGYPGLLRRLLGIWVEEFDALPPEVCNEIVIEDEYRKYFPKDYYTCNIVFDVIHLEGANSIGYYKKDYYQGKPVVTLNKFGNGYAYYIGSMPDNEFLKDFIKFVSERHGVKPLFENIPYGVEITQRVKDNITYTFVLNHSDEKRRINIGNKKIDLLSNKVYEGEIELNPRDVLILKEE